MAATRSISAQPRIRLVVELFEARELRSGFSPTPAEQLFLEELNDARANPAQYGSSIGIDLSSVPPAPPLAFDTRLIQAARVHSQDMNDRGYFAHNTPERTDPGQRLTAAGFAWNGWGESLAGGTAFPEPGDALRALIIDNGVPDLGHRRHLLAMDAAFQKQNLVGIGIVDGGSGPLVDYYTIDTASAPDAGSFLSGTVFHDVQGDGKYGMGEGLGNVTVTVSGIGSITTSDSGAYSIAMNPGTYTVTASGGGLPAPLTQTVTIGTSNYRLNFAFGNLEYVQKLYESILGRTGSDAEIQSWTMAMDGAAGPAGVVAAIEGSPEARTRLVKNWYFTYLGRPALNGEEQGWVDALLHGATEEQVLAEILGSDEFLNRSATLGSPGTVTERYVQSLYTLLLKRTASPDEVNGWQGVLPSASRSGVAAAFLRSPEYRSHVVDGYYMGLLHRTAAPSFAEMNCWVLSDLDLLTIRVAFESSHEFHFTA